MRAVAVVIPNWNGAKLLEQFLPSVFQQTLPPARVVVVDNGSADGSVEMARRLGAEVIEMGSNRGFAAAVNRGVAETSEPLIAIVNNDARLAPDWLMRLTQAMEETGAHLATGKILSERQPDTIDGAFDLLSRGGTAWRAGAGMPDAVFSASEKVRRMVSFVSLTAALVRREAFERAGPLDEEFESYLEDVEFSLRCARLGLQSVYEPGAVAWHRGSATLGAWHADTTRRIARNQVMLVAKHFPDGWPWRAVLVGQLLWGAVAMRHGAGVAYWRGKWQGWRGYAAWRKRSNWARREDGIAEILGASEADMARLQKQTGWQSYWRCYFRLAGTRQGGAK